MLHGEAIVKNAAQTTTLRHMGKIANILKPGNTNKLAYSESLLPDFLKKSILPQLSSLLKY
jgi:hypothetical protein